MSKAYSSDLRNRVIKCFIAKMKHADIAKKLDISLITIGRYSIKYKKEGQIEFKKGAKKGRKPKLTDLMKLCDFVRENNHLTLTDRAKKWGKISYAAIQGSVKKAGLTFKKKSWLYRERDEEKRKEFIENLKTIPAENLFR